MHPYPLVLRARPRTAALTGVALLLSCLLAIALPQPSYGADAPLETTPLISFNMQGVNNGDSSGGKWTNAISRLARQAPIVMVQEAGPEPPSGAIVQPDIIRTTTDPQGVQRTYHVLHGRWEIAHRPDEWRNVYFLQTQDDPAHNPRTVGGRVNIAMVTAADPDEVQVVENPVRAGRTALGLRFGRHWYFTVHGLSGGGGDSAQLLGAIDTAVRGWQPAQVTYRWTAGGDFNIDPDILQTRNALPAGARFYETQEPTHDNGGRLDYFVTTEQPSIDLGRARRLDGHGSDHVPVRLGELRAAAEPLPLEDVRWAANGDSISYAEGFGSSNGSGYIGYLDAELAKATLGSLLGTIDSPLIAKRAFVGSRRAGGFANEAWPGEEIAQIQRRSEPALSRLQPNVVGLLAGTNDMVHDTDVGQADDRLGAYLGRILSLLPGVTLLVATLPPSTDAGYQSRIDAYNDEVRRVVLARQSGGDHIVLVELTELTTADLSDVVHPNDGGYAKIADAFYQGLLTAIVDGWINPPGTPLPEPSQCNDRNGWQPLGTIAGGVPLPAAADVPSRVRFADLDGDGRADYLVMGDGGSIVAYLNRGTDVPGGGGWQYRGEYASGAGVPADRVRLADINADGRADYLVVHDGGMVDAWVNQGGDSVDAQGVWRPTWQAWPQFARGGTGAKASQVQFADMDGDGKADYLVVDETTGALKEWRNVGGDRPGVDGWDPQGTIARGALSQQYPRLHLTDVNCDRRADYLVTNAGGGIVTYLNQGGDHNGADGWQWIGVTAPGVGDPRVQFADLDGDGRADYLLVGPTGGLTAYRNNGGDPA